MARTIGIDLGTTNSVMATIEGGEPTVIPNAEGERLTPSVVAVTPSGERLVGRFARRQAVTNPENTVFSVKRFMGRKFDDPAVQRDKGLVPYQIRAAKNGDTHLGGDDFDQAIIDYLADEFKKQEGIDLRRDRMALQRLKEAAEKAKIELSSVEQTDVNLPFITADASGPKHLNMTLTRAKLEQLTQPLVERTVPPMDAALKDAGQSKGDIDEGIPLGGPTPL